MDNQEVGSQADQTQANSGASEQTGAESAAAAVESTQTPTEGAVTPEVPVYTPNFKFKAADKEYEFDKSIQALIKDAQTESKIRELYEKSHGLDSVKANRQELRQENRQIKEELGAYKEEINELKYYYNQGDLDSFFQKLQIPENVIYQWVVNKAKLEQLPEDQRAVYEQNRQASLQNRTLEKRLQALEVSRQEAESQSKMYGLQNEFAKPDVSQFAKAFDAKMGKEHAFWEAVCELGEYVYLKSDGKQNLTPAQCVQQAMSAYSKFSDPAQVGTPQPAAGATATAPQANPVKVIPNVGGKSVSPTARKIKTLDELKEYAKKFGAN